MPKINKKKSPKQKRLENKIRREKESAITRDKRLNQLRINSVVRIQNETQEDRDKRLNQVRINSSTRIQNETQDARDQRLSQFRINSSTRIQNETQDARDQRLSQIRINSSTRIQNETQEDRETRLQNIRISLSSHRANENEDEREHRLASMRIYSSTRRNSEDFSEEINQFCENSCRVCTKMCYSKQIKIVKITPPIENILPEEFKGIDQITVCNRCSSNISKLKIPSQAYWNKLHLDEIPNEIKVLTEIEKRLLARIVPFVRIIKLGGRFGQYGFKGQAALFGQDVDELAEQLPLNPNNSGTIIVCESLEGLQNIKEFEISIQRIHEGLKWLISNNPLYAGVEINLPNELNINNFCEIVLNTQVESEYNETTQFVEITGNRRILRGTFNQGHSRFSDLSRGRQCVANSICAIINFNKESNLSIWKSEDLDIILINGNRIYLDSISSIQDIGDGLLSPAQVQKEIVFSQIIYKINVVEGNLEIIGSLKGDEYLINLSSGIEDFFKNSISGILISQGYSVAIFKFDDSFWMFDSHSRGPKGRTAKENGTSFLMSFPSINSMSKLFMKNLPKDDGVYSITPILITKLREEISRLDEQMIVDEEIGYSETPHLLISNSILLPMDNIAPRLSSVVEGTEDDANAEGDGNGDAVPIYKLRRKTEKAINLSKESRAEELGWYYLFPHGKNGLNESREVPITPLDYFQNRILGQDKRFQKIDYLFYALSVVEYHRAQQNVGVCCRMRQSNERPENLAENIHLNMRCIRGSNSYWNTARSELLSMVRNLGAASWFLTLSPNDLNWPDMLKALLKFDGQDIENPTRLSYQQRQLLIEKYPVIVSRHFMMRFQAFLRRLKKNFTILGGKIVDWWWRIEFQNRGSPHVHMLIWCEGLPSFDTEEGIELINKVVKCSLPTDNEKLRKLVERLQIHKHTETCYKNQRTRRCRFNFPRFESETTKILDPDEAYANGGRFFILQRNDQECFVNNYNPEILENFESNMDLQPCGNIKRVAYYIAKYASKSEPHDVGEAVKETLKNVRQRGGNIQKQIFAVSMAILNRRLVSACECVFRLCHLPLKGSSRKSIFLNTCKPELRYRMLRLDGDGENDVYTNVFEKYSNRPINLEHLSLAEFAVKYENTSVKNYEQDDGDEDLYENEDNENPKFIKLLNRGGLMKIRTRNAVLRTRYYTQTSDREGYFYNLLVCHILFRHESELLQGHESAEQAFMNKRNQLRPLVPGGSAEEFHGVEQELNQVINQIQALNYETNENDELNQDNQDEINLDEVYNNNCEFEIEIENIDEDNNRMTDDLFNNLTSRLNSEQSKLFVIVTNRIRSEILNNSNSEILRIFVTGGAGTGKTFLLKLIVEQIIRCYLPTQNNLLVSKFVEVGAWTGVAARLVNGKTLHSLLGLQIEKGEATCYRPLTGMKLQEQRTKWRSIRWLIIDEISMVSYETIRIINLRLQELKMNEEIFGGINIIYFGDLMQLPPVGNWNHFCFIQSKKFIGETHLWRLFKFFELKQNMRQAEDQSFIEILNNLRFGELTMEHLEILMTRKVPLVDDFADGEVIHIYPTLKMVEMYNDKMSKVLQTKTRIYTINANDISREPASYGNKASIEKIPKDPNKCGGLLGEIKIGIGSRIMLRRNINVSNGLVNGALGVIKGIKWNLLRRDQLEVGELPYSVEIEFDDKTIGLGNKNSNGFIEVKSVSSTFQGKSGYGCIERIQLPIILAWAVTVHKLQGTTLDKAVVNLGKKLFAKGQAYVALSRVRSLDGLAINELAANKLLVNPHDKRALEEMERLRSSSTLE